MLFLMALGIIGGVVYFTFFTDFMRISKIKVIGDSKFVNVYDVETLIKNQAIGQNIILFDSNKLSKSLALSFQGAKKFDVKKKLPDTLELYIYERIPMLLISNKTDSDLYMVDIEGYILGNVREDFVNLPRLIYSGDIKVGYFINRDLVPVFTDIQKAMDENNLQMSSVSFNDRYTHLFLNNDIEVFIGNKKNKSLAISILADLIKQFKIEGKSLKKIDLRYDKVIVE